MSNLRRLKFVNNRKRFFLWVNLHQPITRLVVIATGLLLVVVFLPSYIRQLFWNDLLTHKVIASMLLVFCVLAISLIWAAGQRLDAWIFIILNVRGKRPVWLDRVMSGFTQLGNGLTTLGIAFLLILTGKRLLSYELMLGTVALWLTVELIKFTVHRSRPFIRLIQTRIVGGKAIGRSFPSGHTSQVFFTATLIVHGFHLPIWVTILLYSIAVLVGITRIYVGAHYPRDVMAGAILGTAWGLLGVIVDSYVFG
jgi:membrane-associated phospholipid phosphatase